MSERNATPAQHTHIDRFAVYEIPDAQISCMHFESSSDVGPAISKSGLSDTDRIDSEESQVLVRLNVDDEDYAIVHVDSSHALDNDDVAAIDRAIEMLQVARQQLRRMSDRNAS